ncbi:MAG TPA: methyltransferase domain-containing protein [Burkholderiales bacterium]|nr:methyltransferase domain-containing protein [Burkholderiales bacterium]
MNARALSAATIVSLVLALPAPAADKTAVNAGPYVPSPSSVVSDMLKLADVGPKDFVIDLGSGDGRIVLTAAKVFGARGFGVDINEKLVKEANEAAKQQGIADRASFTVQDLFKTDIRKATVVTMYLLPDTVNMLKDKLLSDLAPGTRILSHDYGLAGWMPDRTMEFDLQDKVIVTGVSRTIIFLYTVPARVEGDWIAKVPPFISKQPVGLTLTPHRVIRVAGEAKIAGKEVALHEGIVHGDNLQFRLVAGGASYEFTGTIREKSIEGTLDGGGLKGSWSAERAK